MTNNFNFSSQMNQPHIDGTLIKVFLNTVKEGDLQQIVSDIEKYRYDLKVIKDTQYDQSALFYAALIPDDSKALNVIKYFIDELNVDPFATDKIKQTVLYYAAREGKFLTCKYLVEKGLPLNDVDLYSQTPIYYAARDGRKHILELLLNSGANPDLEDKYGQTCLFYAIREGHTEIVDYLTSCKQFTKIDKADKKGLTPYVFALKHNKNHIAELLVNKGANQQQKVTDKKTKSKKVKHEEAKVEEDIQKPKRFLIVRINEHGEKTHLTLEQLLNFQKNYPEAWEPINNREALAELEANAPEGLENYDSWEKVAKRLMNSLWKLKDSEIFHKPVNAMELGIPDYHDIIKTPMDFSTIKRNLNNSTYTNCKQFKEHMELVFNNCILYNGERSVIGVLCNKVREEYKKLYEQLDMKMFE